ncbi:MAG: recombinase family protein [Oligoflexia bacterium]|nr:recombinase family protein [Oligoflexia bacterium]
MNPKYTIGLYIRVSTEEQAENPEGSIKNQEERLRGMIKLKNMETNFGEIIDVYIDRAKSGKDTNRPELQRLLHDIRTKKINLVMASELSRISRSMRDFSEIWELMKKSGCGFYSLRENFDTTTAAGEMVLYTLANLAQFERRQVSERVSANMNARAARGLYNGGSVPVGYRLNPDKPGTLEIDPKNSEVVKACFSAFRMEGTLSKAARWLNENKYSLPKKVQGGGMQQRLDFFTVDNLHHILTSKCYLGIRQFKENGEIKEVKALWEPIIDRDTFESVQQILKDNKSAKKPSTQTRYPYILTGLVRCDKCGDSLVGKSAHGKTQKIGYYEHGWATKRQSCLTQKIFKCDPHRVLAKVLESFVLKKIEELMTQKEFAYALVKEASEFHEKGSAKKQIERLKSNVYGYNSQLEAMAERLSQLPKNVSPKPIFIQMEKIEKLKEETETKIADYLKQGHSVDKPVELKEYELFLKHLRSLLLQNGDKELQNRIIKRIVKKIYVGPNYVKINFMVGELNISLGTDDIELLADKKESLEGESLEAQPFHFFLQVGVTFSP